MSLRRVTSVSSISWVIGDFSMTWAIFSHEEQLQAIGEMLNASDARIIAVVGRALLDEHLRRTLAERLRDDSKVRDKLLSLNRPIGNAGPRNDLLYMLHAYDRKIWGTIDGIISVGNFFAHDLSASFGSTDNKFVSAMAKMKLHENQKYYPRFRDLSDSENEIEKVKNNRIKLLVNLKFCLLMLMHDRVNHETWTNNPLPKTAAKKETKKRPPAKKSPGRKKVSKKP